MTPGGFSDEKAREIAENLVWLREYSRQREATTNATPTAAEFSVRVEAELAKGLSEVEALHAVVRDYPEHYDAYRNAAFLD